MLEPPLVTVLLPTIGRMDYFPAALAAVRAQTCSNLEILIGDNASTDGTAAFIEEMKARDPRIRSYLESERSMPVNWQRGLDLARGEFLTIVSDDDLVQPEFVERCLAPLRADASLAVASCWCELIDGEGRPLPNLTAHQQAGFREFGAGRQILHWRAHALSSTIMCCVLRTAWVRALGFAREAGLAADADLFWRAGVEGYAAYFLQEPLVRYRVHTGAASRVPVAQLRDSCAALTRLAVRHPEVRAWAGWQRGFRAALAAHVVWLIRTDQRREAWRTLWRHRAHFSWNARGLLLAKWLLNLAGLYPRWLGRLPPDPQLR